MAFEEANDAVACERSICSENHCKVMRVFSVTVHLYVLIFWGPDACGGRKL